MRKKRPDGDLVVRPLGEYQGRYDVFSIVAVSRPRPQYGGPGLDRVDSPSDFLAVLLLVVLPVPLLTLRGAEDLLLLGESLKFGLDLFV